MIDKKTFTKRMKELVKLIKDAERVNAALKKFDPDFNSLSFSRHEDLIVKLLQDSVGDKYDWIPYWLYDCELGTDTKNKVSIKGKNIPITTPGELYDMILGVQK